MLDLDEIDERSRLTALVYRLIARQIKQLDVPAEKENRGYVQDLINEEASLYVSLANIYDPPSTRLYKY
jgi:hypothetical protein